jgi:hypothetical protein
MNTNGVDFDTITDEQARAVNDRVFANYQDARWFQDVVTNRANIVLMLIDPYWARLKFETSYPFQVLVFNATTLVRGSTRSTPRCLTSSLNCFPWPAVRLA